MNILGINLNHMSSACLVKNGKLIGSAVEERFTRNKLTRDFPYNSIKFCLKKANLNFTDIDAVSIAWNPAINLEVYKKAFHKVIDGFQNYFI